MAHRDDMADDIGYAQARIDREREMPPGTQAQPGTRLVVLEVADTKSEDWLRAAIEAWNEGEDNDLQIRHRFLYSCPVGRPEDLR